MDSEQQAKKIRLYGPDGADHVAADHVAAGDLDVVPVPAPAPASLISMSTASELVVAAGDDDSGGDDADTTNTALLAHVQQDQPGSGASDDAESDYTSSEYSSDSIPAPALAASQMSEQQLELFVELEYVLELDDLAAAQGGPRISVSTEYANRVRNNIWKYGGSRTISYLMAGGRDLFAPSDPAMPLYGSIFAALGFPLPVDLVARVGDDALKDFLPVILRQVMRMRKRLPAPRTIEQIVDIIHRAQNVIVLTGAGISTSLGIPDFRSESTGIYSKLAHLGLSDPQEVFSIDQFHEDPSVFYSVAKDILPATTTFSPTHKFIKLLQDHGKLLRNYTQNIDNLEHYAGIEHDRLVQCHGSFAVATCVTCGYTVDGEAIFDDIRSERLPKCPRCLKGKVPAHKLAKRKRPQKKNIYGYSTDDEESDSESPSYGVMKPNITFFGEQLPSKFEDTILGGDATKCDLLICIGTSLRVAPVSEITRIIPPHVPQIYMSRTPVSHTEFDVTFLGDCDLASEWLCRKLDWNMDHPMATNHDPLVASFEDGVYRLLASDGSVIERLKQQVLMTPESGTTPSMSTAEQQDVSSPSSHSPAGKDASP